MQKFINYQHGELSLNTYRLPTAYVTDIDDLVIAVSNESEETLTVSVNEGMLDILCDGHYWQGSDVTQHGLEAVYNLLSEA